MKFHIHKYIGKDIHFINIKLCNILLTFSKQGQEND